MKHNPRIFIFAILLIAALSLAACDATGAVAIEDLTGGIRSNTTMAGDSLSSSPRDGMIASVEGSMNVSGMGDSSSSEDFELKGMVEDVTANSITINGVTFTVDTTEDLTTLFEIGMVYELEYTLNADSSISLISFYLEDMDDSSDDEYEFEGMLEDVTENTLTFNGETFTVDTTEDLTTLFTAGEYYEIEYYLNADGTITLDSYSLEDMDDYSDDMSSGSSDDYNDDNNSDDEYDDNNDSDDNDMNNNNNDDDNDNNNDNNNDDNNND